MEEPPQHPPGEGIVTPKEVQKQQTGRSALTFSQPASIADTAPSVGASDLVTDSQAKVAVPRNRGAIAPQYSRRVPQACQSCHQRKTKCSGDTPVADNAVN